METTERPFGPHAAAILATEHWSLLATRSRIWNEAMTGAGDEPAPARLPDDRARPGALSPPATTTTNGAW